MKIRVLVVDDSLFMRTFITRMLQEDQDIEIVGTAANGVQAVELVKQLRPQVVTMDIEMPVMNGLDALKRIMDECPTSVIMLSTLTAEGADLTVQALQCGAIDFLKKPANVPTKMLDVKEKLLAKIKMAAHSNVQRSNPVTRRNIPMQSAKSFAEAPVPALPIPSNAAKLQHIVAIGTSTGGPRALEAVLPLFPRDFPHPIVVVQHMPATFTRSLATRMNMISNIHVTEAADGDSLLPGTAYIAPGGLHMEVARHFHNYRVHLHQGPKRNEHRPSVDVLFESLVPLNTLTKHVVLMTGMGSDGAIGMQLLKQTGTATTIAEAQSTCVVFGMPRAAIERNCVDYVLPLQNIADKIMATC
ncbi:protein-glutamate methylesterase/protein-glutamine glutaminase [Alicyclobacillus dauci]|uniref:Protein-glutamate methylesterase/protein-glutamine glutaminase n=1 Tax=Alicyclobacillus dauci TaxID=1475485 RepID=A0ABY6Z0S9_9BACL|nr:chemotaxis response regulator protein-glutamate methylesterase [Alicyclobacillus dauci]WAH36477.1 chemotaxis response regulator protein-glutamate methylesterase [Alicyclobacillus dauci]